jgi:hypothetical protein
MESMRPTAGRGRQTSVFAGAVLAVAALVAGSIPGLASADGQHLTIRSAASMRHADTGPIGPVARRAITQGYLVPDQARYERRKARLSRRNEARDALASPAAGGPLAPSAIRSWTGINNPLFSPPDGTSAVGTSRYIELVNSNFGIYNKTSNTPIRTGTLNSLIGAPSGTDSFDVQILWDAQTNRFYYAADEVLSSNNNRVAFGFSKTASPNSAADWCKYSIGFGAIIPDFPKLGDSEHFVIIGVNRFDASNNFLGSQIEAISKPGGGGTCPAASSFKEGGKVLTGGFTPTPANEIDTSSIGWAVARTLSLPGNKLQLYRITRDGATGKPVISGAPKSVPVPSYNLPPDAPQQGSTHTIDTNDGRNTQAQAAIDPAHGDKFAIWTQHTVRGGAGAEVRWYEINPAGRSVIQKGKVTSPSLFEYNGAIAPNRRVNGSTESGGDAMVLNFNTSSSAAKPGIRMVSKIGTAAQSSQVRVKKSPGQLSGFDCAGSGACRWGDYAAVTPDPSTANQMWNVSQFAVGSGSGTSGPATSRTFNFVVRP